MQRVSWPRHCLPTTPLPRQTIAPTAGLLQRSLLQPHERLRGHTGAPAPLQSRHWVGTFPATGVAAAPPPETASDAAAADGADGGDAAAAAGDPSLQLGALALRFLPPNSETLEISEKLPFLPKVLDGQLGRWGEKEGEALDVAVRRAAGALLYERELQVRGGERGTLPSHSCLLDGDRC
jgi:hypothetical protein